MVFYFSGTGNSAFVARCIAKESGDELVSINDALKEGRWEDYHLVDTPLIFVSPTYCWRLPRIVEKFIRATNFTGNNKAYFLLTCGSEAGNAIHYVRELCKEKDFQFYGFSDLIMPENYTALFTCPEPKEANQIVTKAYNRLLPYIELIIKGEKFPIYKAKHKFLSAIAPIYYALIVHAKKFRVSEECIACGKCVELCPLGNISMNEDKQIIYADHCTHCMACINSCPSQAIDYGRRTKGKHRYLFSKDIDEEAITNLS